MGGFGGSKGGPSAVAASTEGGAGGWGQETGSRVWAGPNLRDSGQALCPGGDGTVCKGSAPSPARSWGPAAFASWGWEETEAPRYLQFSAWSFQEGCMLWEDDHKYSLLGARCAPQASRTMSLQGYVRSIRQMWELKLREADDLAQTH